jgi:hypothetical protein
MITEGINKGGVFTHTLCYSKCHFAKMADVAKILHRILLNLEGEYMKEKDLIEMCMKEIANDNAINLMYKYKPRDIRIIISALEYQGLVGWGGMGGSAKIYRHPKDKELLRADTLIIGAKIQ